MTEYRYKTFGANGTIKLTENHVTTKARSHLGWFEQSVPYSALNPIHGTLKTTPQGLFATLGLAGVFVSLAIFALLGLAKTTIQFGLYGSLLLCGLFLFWYVPRYLTIEWNIFYTNDGGRGVGYPRTKGMEQQFDDLTELIKNRIEQARENRF